MLVFNQTKSNEEVRSMNFVGKFLESSTLSRKMKLAARMETGVLEIKSKFDAEFRRFSIDLRKEWSLKTFQNIIREVHKLENIPFDLTYTDNEGDLLPLNNDDNFHHALNVSRPILRLVVQHKGTNQYGFNTLPHARKNIISRLLEGDHSYQTKNNPYKNISQPENFRCVSAIIDVDILPATQRRVKLIKSQSDKPLGFFVRDGYSILPTVTGGLERIPGIFISRLVPGGLAASTGLLAVNDEVLEVNGIEVAGKTLDQVTDMMVANSSNLIITIKPCNQHTNIKMNEDDEMINFRPAQSTTNNNNNNNVVTTVPVNSTSVINDNNNFSDDEDDVKDFVRQDPSGCSNTNSIGLQQQQLLQQLQQQHSQYQSLQQQPHQKQNQLQHQQLQHQQSNQQPFEMPQNLFMNHQKSDSLNYNNNNNNNFINTMSNNNNIISTNNNNIPSSNKLIPSNQSKAGFESSNSDNTSLRSITFNNNSQRNKNSYNSTTQQSNNHSFNTNKPFRNELRSSTNFNSDLSLNSTKNFQIYNNDNHINNNNNNNNNNNITQIRRSFKEYNSNNQDNNYDNSNNKIIIGNNNKYNDLVNPRAKQQMIVTNLQSLKDLDDYDQEQLRFVEGGPMHSANVDCNQFISSKPNDFYNFTNSSLRVIPNKYRNLNNITNNEHRGSGGRDGENFISPSFHNDARASSRSVDYQMASRKKNFQL